MTEQPNSRAWSQIERLPCGVFAGATYPVRAVAILVHYPRLWGSILMPILINVVIGTLLYVGLLRPLWQGIDQSWHVVNQWLVGLPTWAIAISNVVDDMLRWLLALVLFILTGLLLVQFGAIFGAPWYGNLAEQVERLQMEHLPPSQPTFGRAFVDIWRAIAFQGKKFILAIALSIPLLVLNIVPPIGTIISSVGWIALAALLIGLDFLDPPLERRRLRFRTKLGIIGRTLPASASFSLGCLTLVSVPWLNLLTVPICVIAGTLFCCDRVRLDLLNGVNSLPENP
jgi:CysZ protein